MTLALRRQILAVVCQVTKPKALSGQDLVSRQNDFGVLMKKIVVLVLRTIINWKEFANLVVPEDSKRADVDLVDVVARDYGTFFLIHRLHLHYIGNL